MINIRTYPFYKCVHSFREIQSGKKYIRDLTFVANSIMGTSNFNAFLGQWAGFLKMTYMKYLLSTTFLILWLFCPIQAQEVSGPASAANGEIRPVNPLAVERLLTASSTNYLHRLALRGFNLESQGVLIESLDGRAVYADLNSSVGFNPASVIKVATSFDALSKLGPEYHFETGFYADGPI